ncbi:MAG: hypothetical protein V9G24_14600 [Rhodoblastus sp.]
MTKPSVAQGEATRKQANRPMSSGAPAAGGENARQPEAQARIDRQIEAERDPAAALELGLKLQAARRHGCFGCRHRRMSHPGFLQQKTSIRKRHEA